MFERLTARVERRAGARAREVAVRLTEKMRDGLPRGMRAEAGADGVLLSGRDLKRRFALEAGLRWLRLR